MADRRSNSMVRKPSSVLNSDNDFGVGVLSTAAAGRISPFSRLPPIGKENAKNNFGANVHTIASLKPSPCSNSSYAVGKESASSMNKVKPVPPIKPKLQMPVTGGKQIRSQQVQTSKISKPPPLSSASSNAMDRGVENKDFAHSGTRHVVVPLSKPSSNATGNESSRSPSLASGKRRPGVSGYGDVRKKPAYLTKSESVTELASVTPPAAGDANSAKPSRPKSVNTTPVKIKVCVKLPNSSRQILNVNTSTKIKEIVTMLEQRKKFLKNPEFATSDIPAKRVSGKDLAITTVFDLGIENNSVLHCEEL